MTLQQMQQNYEDARSRATGLLERARTQARTEAREMSTSEKAYIDAALKEARSWRDRIDRARGDANMLTELDRITGSEGTSRSSTRGWRSRHAFGQQVVDSEMFQWLLKHRGQLPSGQWTSPSSELPSAFDLMGATISSDPSSGGDLILPDHRPGIVPLPMRPLTIADLMASGTTESNTVMYMKETSVVNAAAAVAEGAPKPESTIVFDAATDPVRKLATWIPITEEMLEDVPAMRAYLDTRLRYFVQLVEDDQLLNGDGTAPNISGILDRPGISAPIARTTESNADVILKQISAIETATQLPVDGIVMHPVNWDAVLLLKGSDGHYVAGGGPFVSPMRKTLWGRSVSVTPANTINTAVVGAWKTAAQFFRRGGLRVEASNSHADFFIKNLVAIRAEERGALAVYREAAFGQVTNLN